MGGGESDDEGVTLPAGNGIVYPNGTLVEFIQKHLWKSDKEVFLVQPANLEFVLSRLPAVFETIKPPEVRLFLKAAFLLERLAAQAHAFNNGNKRMAFMAAAVFLHLNGFDLTVKVDDVRASVLMKIAEGALKDHCEIARWLRENSKSIG